MPSQETKRRPVAVTAAFFLVLTASFMTWGTIRYYYTWQFMANLEHPGEKHPDWMARIDACFNMRHDILVKGE